MNDNVTDVAEAPKKELSPEFEGLVHQLISAGDWPTVKSECISRLEEGEVTAAHHFLLALSYFAEDDYANASIYGSEALRMEDTVSEYADFLAIIYSLVGDIHKSLYFAKTASTGYSSPKAQEWMSGAVPTLAATFSQIEEHPLLHHAILALEQSAWASAEYWFSQHMHFYPDSPEGYLGLANCLSVQGQFRSAVEILRGGRLLLPDNARIMGLLGTSLIASGQYAEGAMCHRIAREMAPDIPDIASSAIIDSQFDPGLGAADMIRMHAEWGRSFGVEPVPGMGGREAREKETLTVGYVVGAVEREHVAPALAEIIAATDQKVFNSVGFGVGQLSDTANVVFQKCFPTWRDIVGVDPYTLSSMVAAEGVDILIDLNGFVLPTTATAFGQRMAPVQISWTIAPCGTGLKEMDVQFTDAFIRGDGQGEENFTEKLVNLENGSMLLRLPEGEPVRKELKPEERPLTFAADTSLAELNLQTVELWSRILHACPGSILILKDHDFRNESNTASLIGLFGNMGVAHRVDVLFDADDKEFYEAADICLVPTTSRRLNVGLEALWHGLPTIVLAGDGPHLRGMASALNSMGLSDDCVAQSLEAYVDLTVGWAGNDERRKEFGDNVAQRMKESAFFDYATRAKTLEDVLKSLWQEACGA